MTRDPVGSLEAPAVPFEHEVLAAGEVRVYLHPAVVQAAKDPARIEFDLGPRGRCCLRMDPP